MKGRHELGAADVSDEELATMVASLLGQRCVKLLESRADPVDYDLPAITTGGRWWVSGQAETECGRMPFRFFVKQVQSWERHPFFAFVPEEFRELAVAGVPWKTEAEVYRSDLALRLPQGLSAPRALGVFDLDASSSAIWIEEVRPGRRTGTAGATSEPPIFWGASPPAVSWRRWPACAMWSGRSRRTRTDGWPSKSCRCSWERISGSTRCAPPSTTSSGAGSG